MLHFRSTTRRLLAARALRSIGQGALVVDFALYLHALHWSGGMIGLVMGGGGLFGSGLGLLVGSASDRLGRRVLLLVYAALSFAANLVALLTAQPALLAAAAIIAGFGRGAGGAAGPFSPVEQAWLAGEIAPHQRGRIFSINMAGGMFGMALGAFLAMLPAYWQAALPGALAFRPIFALSALIAVATWFLMLGARETSTRPRPAADAAEQEQIRNIRRQENRAMGSLLLINTLAGLAIGLTGPLIPYWFALRFHTGPASIAPVMGGTFLATGVLSLVSARLAGRVSLVSIVVWQRLAGALMLVLLPLAPWFWLASLAYALRAILTRSSAGAQQALTVSLVRGERRGLAASLNAASMQLPRSVGLSAAGYLLEAGQLTLPFFVAAALQGIYLLGYRRLFRRYEPRADAAGDEVP